MAREGLAPGALAKADPRSRTPWNAQLLVLAVAASAPIGLGLWQGSYLAAFGWTGQVIVFFILIPHLAVNLANPLYHLRYRRERFHWLANAVVPALGLAIDGYVLYIAFFQNLLAKPFKSGASIVWLSLAWAILRHDLVSLGMGPASRPPARSRPAADPAGGKGNSRPLPAQRDRLLGKSTPRHGPRPCQRQPAQTARARNVRALAVTDW